MLIVLRVLYKVPCNFETNSLKHNCLLFKCSYYIIMLTVVILCNKLITSLLTLHPAASLAVSELNGLLDQTKENFCLNLHNLHLKYFH